MNKRQAKKKFKNKVAKLIVTNKNDLIILSGDNISDFTNSAQWYFVKLAARSTGVNIITLPSKIKVNVLKDIVDNSVAYDKSISIINNILDIYKNKEYDKIDDIYNYLSNS